MVLFLVAFPSLLLLFPACPVYSGFHGGRVDEAEDEWDLGSIWTCLGRVDARRFFVFSRFGEGRSAANVRDGTFPVQSHDSFPDVRGREIRYSAVWGDASSATRHERTVAEAFAGERKSTLVAGGGAGGRDRGFGGLSRDVEMISVGSIPRIGRANRTRSGSDLL